VLRHRRFGCRSAELNIDIICANSPQAKGRVERAFGTLQDDASDFSIAAHA
jgi:hypothetical protein